MFFKGFLCGIFFKQCIDYIVNIFCLKPRITNLNLVCHIKDYGQFLTCFPDEKVQPFWSYFPKKGVIKIELEQDLIRYLNKKIQSGTYFEYTLYDIYNLKQNGDYLTGLDFDFLHDIGEIYLYVEYSTFANKYINIYEYNDVFNRHDLNCNSKPKANNVSIKFEKNVFNITSYYNKFINNKYPIQSKLLLLNYDCLDNPVEMSEIVLKKHKHVITLKSEQYILFNN